MNKVINIVTINTDASYCNHKNNSGYAFWIKCNEFTLKHHGQFKEHPGNSEKAEMMAIGNAIAGLKQQKGYQINTIVINSDCVGAIRKIKKNNDELANKINLIFGELNNPKVVFKHVKGHTKDTAARSWVNRWCDKMANKARKSK